MTTHDPQSQSSAPQATEAEALAVELERRVIYAMLVPSVRLSRRFMVSLKEAGEWVELAYLRELLNDGLKLKEAAEQLGVSVRKVSGMASRLRENFFAPEHDHELPARVEFMLWAAPQSRKRVKQYLSHVDEEAIDAAFELLESQGRIRAIEGRTTTYEITQSAQRLVRGELMSRIDALNTLLSNVTDAVFGRFFQSDERAFARSLQLRVRAQDMPRLKRLYEEEVWKTLRELDEAARDDPGAIELGATICWAPLELARGEHGTGPAQDVEEDGEDT